MLLKQVVPPTSLSQSIVLGSHTVLLETESKNTFLPLCEGAFCFIYKTKWLRIFWPLQPRKAGQLKILRTNEMEMADRLKA